MAKRATPQKGRVLQRTKGSPANPAKSTEEKEGNGPATADRETFHYFVGEITKYDNQIAAIRKFRKDCRRKASDAGVNLADMDMVMKMREHEPETVQERIKRLAVYSHWMNLAPGIQADLFEAADAQIDAEKVAEDEGYVEGLEGKTATGERYDVANPIGQARLKGWNRGQDIIKERFLNKQAEEGATIQ